MLRSRYQLGPHKSSNLDPYDFTHATQLVKYTLHPSKLIYNPINSYEFQFSWGECQLQINKSSVIRALLVMRHYENRYVPRDCSLPPMWQGLCLGRSIINQVFTIRQHHPNPSTRSRGREATATIKFNTPKTKVSKEPTKMMAVAGCFLNWGMSFLPLSRCMAEWILEERIIESLTTYKTISKNCGFLRRTLKTK